MKEGTKEMFYLTTHSTHFIYGYMASDLFLNEAKTLNRRTERKEGRKEMFYLTVIWRQTYGRGLLLPIISKGSFICTIPQIGLHILLDMYIRFSVMETCVSFLQMEESSLV